MPHTIGPSTRPGPTRASWREVRPHARRRRCAGSSAAPSAPRPGAGARPAGSGRPADGGSVAAARISSTAGRRRLQVAPVAVDLAGVRRRQLVERSARRRGGAATADRPTTPPPSPPGPCRCSAGRASARSSSSITGVVRNVMWSQLQMLTVRAGEGLAGRRAADDRAGLEHERAQPGPGQVGRGHQPVVPAADDDRVVIGAGAQRRSRRPLARPSSCPPAHLGRPVACARARRPPPRPPAGARHRPLPGRRAASSCSRSARSSSTDRTCRSTPTC